MMKNLFAITVLSVICANLTFAQSQKKANQLQRFLVNSGGNLRYVEVVSSNEGRLDLRFNDTRTIGGGWSKDDLFSLKGCSKEDVCVGERYIVTSDDGKNRYAEIVGIRNHGEFQDDLALRFDDTSTMGSGWSKDDLFSLKGCSKENVCVGERYIVTSDDGKNRYAEIVGIRNHGEFQDELVLKFDDTGTMGSGWTKSHLHSINN